MEKAEIFDESIQIILTIYIELIFNNENKRLSRNRKRRIERKTKMEDKKKTSLTKIKSEKKKNKSLDKIKELEIELVKIKYSNILNKF